MDSIGHYVKPGKSLSREIVRFFEQVAILNAASISIESLENVVVKNAAQFVINCFSDEIAKQEKLSSFPPLYGFSADDGSFLMAQL